MYRWSVFIHLIIVAFWLGGMLFTAAVLVPATRKRLADQKGRLFTILGTLFSRLSWILFPVLVLTGYLALLGRGFDNHTLLSATFWQSEYGARLLIKLILFGIVLILSAVHDFWLGPKAATLMQTNRDTSTTEIYRKASSWAGRLNLLLGLGILYMAVSLVR